MKTTVSNRDKNWGDTSKTYSLGDVIDHNSTVGVSIVHRSQGLISFLASSIPNFEFDGGALIEGYGLCQESSADS
jgi:hypothetical protein